MNLHEKYDYVIEIAGNKLSDKEYLFSYVAGIIKELFNIQACQIEKKYQNSIYLRVRSKAIFNYLFENGFKKGRKEQIGVPLWIIKNDVLMQSFVKGFFDTDGCLSIKNKEGKKYPTISISSKSKKLIKIIRRYVTSKCINSCFIKDVRTDERFSKQKIVYKIEVNGFVNIERWFELIGSSNKRNLNKYSEATTYRKGLKKH